MTDWTAVGSVATAASAVASTGVLAVAVYQLRLLRRQVGDNAQGVEAAHRSADAAVKATVESSKARADANAPRFVVRVDQPSWPPLLDRIRSGMPYANELRLLAPLSLHQGALTETGTSFLFDRDRSAFLWFQMSGVVENEGAGSAFVRLDGEAHFNGHGHGDQVLIRPGQSLTFTWGTGLSLADWAEQHQQYRPGRTGLVATAMDFQEHGVIDHVYVELGGRALEPEPGVTGGWRVTNAEHLNVVVYPSRRTYRWEWPDKRQLSPWEEQESAGEG